MVWEIQLIINHSSKVSGYFCNLKITLYQWQSVRSQNRSQELSWLATVQLGYFCAVDASSRLAPLFSSVTLIGWFYIQSNPRARPRSTSARHQRLQNSDRLANYAMCSADKRIRLAECLADAPPICKDRRRIGWLRPSCAFTFFRFLMQQCGVTLSVLPFNSITTIAHTAQFTFIGRSDKENEHRPTEKK